jgi:hypothetical protein
MTPEKSITEDLRAQLSSLDGRRAELLSERDELSYLALIDKEPKAIKRLTAINEEIRNLTFQIETNEAALKEAIRRETVARDEAAAEARRQNAREAEMLCIQAESIAEGMDAAFAMLVGRAQEYETMSSPTTVWCRARQLPVCSWSVRSIESLNVRAIGAPFLFRWTQFRGSTHPAVRRFRRRRWRREAFDRPRWGRSA